MCRMCFIANTSALKLWSGILLWVMVSNAKKRLTDFIRRFTMKRLTIKLCICMYVRLQSIVQVHYTRFIRCSVYFCTDYSRVNNIKMSMKPNRVKILRLLTHTHYSLKYAVETQTQRRFVLEINTYEENTSMTYHMLVFHCWKFNSKCKQ